MKIIKELKNELELKEGEFFEVTLANDIKALRQLVRHPNGSYIVLRFEHVKNPMKFTTQFSSIESVLKFYKAYPVTKLDQNKITLTYEV